MKNNNKELRKLGLLKTIDGVDYYSFGTIKSKKWLLYRKEIEIDGKKIVLSFQFKGSIHAPMLNIGEIIYQYEPNKDKFRDLCGRYFDCEKLPKNNKS
jgi:hypothetical protein